MPASTSWNNAVVRGMMEKLAKTGNKLPAPNDVSLLQVFEEEAWPTPIQANDMQTTKKRSGKKWRFNATARTPSAPDRTPPEDGGSSVFRVHTSSEDAHGEAGKVVGADVGPAVDASVARSSTCLGVRQELDEQPWLFPETADRVGGKKTSEDSPEAELQTPAPPAADRHDDEPVGSQLREVDAVRPAVGAAVARSSMFLAVKHQQLDEQPLSPQTPPAADFAAVKHQQLDGQPLSPQTPPAADFAGGNDDGDEAAGPQGVRIRVIRGFSLSRKKQIAERLFGDEDSHFALEVGDGFALGGYGFRASASWPGSYIRLRTSTSLKSDGL